MTATAYKDVLHKAVKKGNAVKKAVLEEIAIEDEMKREREIQKEVEKRLQESELAKVNYPYGQDPHNPQTVVKMTEDEVYGNLPMSFKVDISDAVEFVEAWDAAKPTDMRAAFMQSHLTNKVKDEYFDELRKRLEVAKREGHTQVTMPTPNQEMIEEMDIKKAKEGTGSNDDLAVTLAPLLTLQKIMGEDNHKEPQEKPTEIVKTIMETAKGISEGKEKPESQTEMVKGIIEIAKELNPSQGQDGAMNPIEVTNAIIAAAQVMTESKQPESQQTPDMLQQITAVSELVNALSNKSNGGSNESKIQIPREDGTMMEMTVQQYMLSEMLKTKLADAQQPQHTQDQKQPSDTIQIQDPDGTVRTMPATAYISELALKRVSEQEEQTPEKSSEAERVSQDNTKLMAALVATVERLSTEVSHLKAQDKKDDPIAMMDSMLAQGEKIDNFRRRFLGGGLTEEDKSREKEELEEQRAHEMRMAQMQTQQANRSALTRLLSPNTGLPEQLLSPDASKQQQPQQQPEPLDEKAYEKETIRQSQRKAERMIEDLAREKALAEKIAEERASRPKARQHANTTPKRVALQEAPVEVKGKAGVEEAEEGIGEVKAKVNMKEEDLKTNANANVNAKAKAKGKGEIRK